MRVGCSIAAGHVAALAQEIQTARLVDFRHESVPSAADQERTPRPLGPVFKSKVALATIKDEKTPAGLAKLFDVRPHQITTWAAQLQESAAGVSGSVTAAAGVIPTIDLKRLHAKTEDLALKKNFVRCAQQGRPIECKAIVDRA